MHLYILFFLFGIIIFILNNYKNGFSIGIVREGEFCDETYICYEPLRCIDHLCTRVEAGGGGVPLPPTDNIDIKDTDLGWTKKKLYKHFKDKGSDILNYPISININKFRDLQSKDLTDIDIIEYPIYNEWDNEIILLYSKDEYSVYFIKQRDSDSNNITEIDLDNSGNSFSEIDYSDEDKYGINHFFLFKNDKLVSRIITGDSLYGNIDDFKASNEIEVVTVWPSGQGYAKLLLKIISSKFPEYQFVGNPIPHSFVWWHNTIFDHELSNMFEYFIDEQSIDQLGQEVENINSIINSFDNSEKIHTTIMSDTLTEIIHDKEKIFNILDGYLQYKEISQDKLVELFTDEDVLNLFIDYKKRNQLINSLNSEQQLDLIDYYINNKSDELLELLSNIPDTNLQALITLYPENIELQKYLIIRGMRGKKRKE